MARRTHAKQLTERDYQILCFVGRGGVATLDQLHRRHWAGKRINTARDRLEMLRRANYLAVDYTDARRPGERIYTLTKQGRTLLPQAERERVVIKPPAPNEMRQQLAMQDARIRLEEIYRAQGGEVVNWRAERELRGEYFAEDHGGQAGGGPEIPDAQAVIQTADAQVQVLDVEIDGQYYGRMLQRKMERFGRGGRPTVWVCGSAKRAAAVGKAAGRYGNIKVLTL